MSFAAVTNQVTYNICFGGWWLQIL